MVYLMEVNIETVGTVQPPLGPFSPNLSIKTVMGGARYTTV